MTTTTQVFAARKIITMNPAQREATHVAVRGGKVLAVGGPAEMAAWPGAEQVDTFRDKVLMPGLVEAHCHLMEGAMWDAVYVGYFDRRDPDGRLWRGLRTLDHVIDRLAGAESQLNEASKPLLAWGFDPIYFGTERLSVRELDRVSASRPIVVMHASVHLMNVNSAMLDLAGINEDTDIDGIHKGPDGQPTGELQEFAAMFPVHRVLGKGLSLAAAEDPEAVRRFGRVAQLAGVTTATDLVSDLSPLGLQTLREVTGSDDFPLRVVPAFAPQRNPDGGPARVAAAQGGGLRQAALRSRQVHRRRLDPGLHRAAARPRLRGPPGERPVADPARPVDRHLHAVSPCRPATPYSYQWRRSDRSRARRHRDAARSPPAR